MFHFYIPWKGMKTFDFLMFSESFYKKQVTPKTDSILADNSRTRIFPDMVLVSKYR